MIEHAGWLITHLRVRADGRTAWQRVTGRVCTQPLVEFGEVVWAKPLRRSAGNRHKVNLEARWFKGVWVGANDRSNEHIVICHGDGPAVRVRTIRRMTEASRWNYEEVDKVRAIPRKPDPRGSDADQRGDLPQNLPEDIHEGLDPEIDFAPDGPGVVGGADLRSARINPAGMRERRNFRITRKLVREHGSTEGCPGCRFVMGNAQQGHGSNPMHTPECRGRFEDLMSRTESGRRRLRARDVRHGLAENLEESRDEDAGGGVGDDREPDEREEDHGDGGDEPNERDDAEQGRRVRRRMNEDRGVRRARENDDDDEEAEEPPRVSRRLGQLERSIADIVKVLKRVCQTPWYGPQ